MHRRSGRGSGPDRRNRTARALTTVLAVVVLSAAGVLVVASAAPRGPAPDASREPLTVFAASSLVPLFSEIELTLESVGLPVLVHFAGSHYLAAQIRAGAPGDLIITADLDHVLQLYEAYVHEAYVHEAYVHEAYVHEASSLTTAPVELFSNGLVLATPSSSGGDDERARPAIDTLLDRLRSGGRLLVADPAVPLGRYTQQWLDALVEREEMTRAERAEIRRGIVSYEESARMVVAKLALGAADLAIVYASDAQSIADEPGLHERLELHPLRLDEEPRYYGAVLASSVRQVQARALLDWLAGPEANEVVEDLGFTRGGSRVAR